MAYVALSRVTSLEGLVIQDYNQEKNYCNEEVTEALQRMPQFLSMKPSDQRTSFFYSTT